MSSCVASCFISCRAASCAFATSVSSQTGGARNCFHFVSAFSSHPINHQHALPPRLPSPRARSGTVRSVAESCRSSSGSLRRNSSSDLHLIPASAQHESTSPVSLLPRASAPTLALCLVSLSNAKLLFNPDFPRHTAFDGNRLPQERGAHVEMDRL